MQINISIAGFGAIATKPNYTAAYIARAEANLYLDNGSAVIRVEDYLRAIEQFNRALEIKPYYDAIYARRGIVYIRIK